MAKKNRNECENNKIIHNLYEEGVGGKLYERGVDIDAGWEGGSPSQALNELHY